MVEECLKFYGVATPNEWEEVYVLTQYLSSSFRKKSCLQGYFRRFSYFFKNG